MDNWIAKRQGRIRTQNGGEFMRDSAGRLSLGTVRVNLNTSKLRAHNDPIDRTKAYRRSATCTSLWVRIVARYVAAGAVTFEAATLAAAQAMGEALG